MSRPEIAPSDVARKNFEVFCHSARIVSLASLASGLCGTALFPHLGNQARVRTLAITLGVSVLEHLVIEAGALFFLSALASAIGWRHLLVRGRTLVERFRSVTDIDRALDTSPASNGALGFDKHLGGCPSDIVSLLLDSLAVAPCAPPLALHLAADRPVRTISHIRAEVRKSL